MKKIATILGVSGILLSSLALAPASTSAATDPSVPILTEQQIQEIKEYQLSPELKAQADAEVQKIAIETEKDEKRLGLSPQQLEAKRVQAASSPVQRAIPEIPNITVDFFNLMHANKKKMVTLRNAVKQMPLAQGKAYQYYTFTQLVKSGGPWDYKQKYGFSAQYIFNKMRMTGEDIGNFHFGYQGKAGGFTDFELKAGAGAYQVWSGTGQWDWIKTYFDDPNDQKWIQTGIDYYGWGY